MVPILLRKLMAEEKPTYSTQLAYVTCWYKLFHFVGVYVTLLSVVALNDTCS